MSKGINLFKLGGEDTLPQDILNNPPNHSINDNDLQYTKNSYKKVLYLEEIVNYPSDTSALFNIVIDNTECNNHNLLCCGLFFDYNFSPLNQSWFFRLLRFLGIQRIKLETYLFSANSFPYIVKDNTMKLRFEYLFEF